MSGLVVFVGYESLEFKLFPMFMAMIGSALYGLSMNYIYKLNVVDTGVMAAVTMVAATFMIAPFLLLDPIIMDNWDLKVVGSVIFLGVFCTRIFPISFSLKGSDQSVLPWWHCLCQYLGCFGLIFYCRKR
jgi:hypothetical protein